MILKSKILVFNQANFKQSVKIDLVNLIKTVLNTDHGYNLF